MTLSPEMTVGETEIQLKEEGLTCGYRPVTGWDATWSECLKERTPNLYFFQYGGLEELVAGGEISFKKSQSFPIKVAPRAATGPDWRLAVLGSQGRFGQFEQPTMRVFPLPQREIWGTATFENQHQARTAFRQWVGFFIRFKFVYFDLTPSDRVESVLAFKLSGPKNWVEATREAITQLHENEEITLDWFEQVQATQLEAAITSENFSHFINQMGALVGLSKEANQKSAAKLGHFLESGTDA